MNDDYHHQDSKFNVCETEIIMVLQIKSVVVVAVASVTILFIIIIITNSYKFQWTK